MQVTSAMWQKHIDQGNQQRVDPTVVFTTEATSMVKEQQAFVSEGGEQRHPFHFEFVTNSKDVTPDSGFMKDIGTTRRCISSIQAHFEALTNSPSFFQNITRMWCPTRMRSCYPRFRPWKLNFYLELPLEIAAPIFMLYWMTFYRKDAELPVTTHFCACKSMKTHCYECAVVGTNNA